MWGGGAMGNHRCFVLLVLREEKFKEISAVGRLYCTDKMYKRAFQTKISLSVKRMTWVFYAKK